MSRLSDKVAELQEEWSPAARAASIASRHKRLLPATATSGDDMSYVYGHPTGTTVIHDGAEHVIERSNQKTTQKSVRLRPVAGGKSIEVDPGTVIRTRKLHESWSDTARAAAVAARRSHAHSQFTTPAGQRGEWSPGDRAYHASIRTKIRSMSVAELRDQKFLPDADTLRTLPSGHLSKLALAHLGNGDMPKVGGRELVIKRLSSKALRA